VICDRFLYRIDDKLSQDQSLERRQAALNDDLSARAQRGVYGISVTSELSGVGPQTLRLYERHGLLTPARTDGGTRRYSDDDLERLRRIAELLDRGINLAGIAQILDLEARNTQLESDNTQLESDNARLTPGHGSPKGDPNFAAEKRPRSTMTSTEGASTTTRRKPTGRSKR
jgi:MerR family transcriptional regulator/heat shock protein HspR